MTSRFDLSQKVDVILKEVAISLSPPEGVASSPAQQQITKAMHDYMATIRKRVFNQIVFEHQMEKENQQWDTN